MLRACRTVIVFLLLGLLAGCGGPGGDDAVNLGSYGAVGDDTGDDTAAIKKALADAAGRRLIIPPGVYIVGGEVTRGAHYFENYIFKLPPGVTIEGAGATFRLRDGLLSGPDENNAHMFSAEGSDNVTIRGLTVDGNGANNLTPAGAIRNAMFIFRSGAGLTVDRVVMRDCAGHNMIATSGPGARVTNSLFHNGGRHVGTDNPNNVDFSFLYLGGDDSVASGNTIIQDVLRGYTGGIELHGARSAAIGNIITGAWPAVYVSPDGPAAGLTVAGNTIIRSAGGVTLLTNSDDLRDVAIVDNDIELYADIEAPAGIGQVSPADFVGGLGNRSAIRNLTIERNSVREAAGMQLATVGIYLNAVDGASLHDNILTGHGYAGLVLGSSPWGVRRLTARGNGFVDCGSRSPHTGFSAMLLAFGSAGATDVLLADNRFSGSTANMMYFAAGSPLANVVLSGNARAAGIGYDAGGLTPGGTPLPGLALLDQP